jgi:hypothetical protein
MNLNLRQLKHIIFTINVILSVSIRRKLPLNMLTRLLKCCILDLWFGDVRYWYKLVSDCRKTGNSDRCNDDKRIAYDIHCKFRDSDSCIWILRRVWQKHIPFGFSITSFVRLNSPPHTILYSLELFCFRCQWCIFVAEFILS